MILSMDRIAELSVRPGANTIAVENFLISMDGLTPGEAMANLEQDVRAYKWNTATGRAIQQGIAEAHDETVVHL